MVDGHPLVRHGLRDVVDRQTDMVVCAEADTLSSTCSAISVTLPDIVVSGLDLDRSEGMELVRSVRAHHPQLPILVMSAHDESIYAERLLAMGANGYIMKQAPTDDVLSAVRRVLAGEVFLSAAMTSALSYTKHAGSRLSISNPIDRLTARERQVMHMAGLGLSTRDTASALALSMKTIESHRQRIRRKLHLENGTQLVQYAIAWLTGQHAAAEVR